MSIRGVFHRFRKWLLWGMGVGALVGGTLVALLLFTPLPDDIGRAWVASALLEHGVSLTAAETTGTLARGLDVKDLVLDKPGQWSLTAGQVHLELSVWSVLRARPQLKEVVLRDARFTLRVDKGGRSEGAREVRLPSLGISRWALENASVRLLREREALPWVGGWSRLDGEGSLSMGGQGLRVSARSLALTPADSRLRPLRASGSASWASGSGVGLDLAAISEGGRLSFRGRVSGGQGPAALRGALVLEEFDLTTLAPFWPGAPERKASAKLDVELSSGRALWDGSVEVPGSGRAEGVGEYLKVTSGHSVRGSARFEAFALGSPSLLPALDRLAPSGSGRAVYAVDVPDGGPPALRLEIEAAPASLYGLDIARAVGNVSWSSGALEVQAQGASPLAETVEVQVGQAPGGPLLLSAQGEGVQVEPLLKALNLWIDPPAPLRLPPDVWSGVDLSLEIREGGALSLTAGGRSDAVRRVQLSVSAPGGGAGARWEVEAGGLVPRPFGLEVEGEINGTLAYHPAGENRGTYRAGVARSRVADVEVEPFEATVRQEGDGFRLAPVRVATAQGSGTLALSVDGGGRVEGSLSFDLADARRTASLLGAPAPEGPLRGEVAFGWQGEAWTLRGQARMEAARWGSVSGKGLLLQGHWGFPAEGGGVALTWQELGAGSQPFGAGGLSLEGPATRVEAQLTAALGTGKEVAFKGVGRIADGALEMALSGGRLKLFSVDNVQEGSARLSVGPKGLALESLAFRGPKGTASLDFRVGGGEPEAAIPTSGALKMEHLDLAALPVPETAGAIAGTLSGDLRWSGTLDAPGLEGSLRVEGGSYRFARSDLTWRPLSLEFVGRGDRFELVRGSATSPEGGEASATGWVQLEDLLPTAFRLDAVGKAMPFVIGKDVEAAADFAVTLSGTPQAPQIAGRALVVKGRILLPDVARQAPLPQSVTFTNAPAGSPFAPLPEGEAPVVGRLRGAVELQSTRGLWVSNRNLLGELTGTVRAEFTDNGVVLRGGLQLGQGRYVFQGKTFDITSARILFNAEGTVLDVTALYVASDGTEVTVRLFGPAERPQVKLSSRPPLDASGILAVLLYDHRPEELDEKERQGWAAAAAVVALQYQSGDMLDSVKKSMGLDAITVVTGDTGESAGVGLTKSIGDKVVVQYQQLFGTVPEERINLRYRINRRLSFRGTSSSVDGTTADLLWEKRY